MADTFQWSTPGTSGTFDAAANWIDQTNSLTVAFPGALDTANLAGPITGAAQTITGPGNVSRLNVTGADLLVGSFVTGITSVDNLGAASLELRGSLSASAGLLVGNANAGALTVDNAATLTASSGDGTNQLVIGNVQGSSGTVTVAAGGTLNLAGPTESTAYGFVIGGAGSGSLVVTGATVNDIGRDGVIIAESANSTGSLTVAAGATATFGSTNSLLLAALSAGRGGNGSVIVNGTGSTLTANGGVYIGRGGAGTLTVANSAVFNETVANTYFQIGEGSFSSNSHIGGTGTAVVEQNGTLATAGYLRVGGYGVNGALTVETGGLVTAVATTLNSGIAVGASTTIGGAYEGGTGSIEIDANSTIQVSGSASPGVAGISIGFGAGAFGTVSVNGTGAVLNTGSNLIVVGSDGTGVLNVTAGGAITGTAPGPTYGAIVIGNSAGSVGTLTVSGSGSTATANGELTVGYQGTGTLIIAGSGAVTATNVSVGSTSTGTGTIEITNPGGGGLSTGNLTIGDGSAITLNGGGITASGTVGLAGGGAITGSGSIDGQIIGAGAITASQGALLLQSVAGGALNIAAGGTLIIGGGGSGVALGEQVSFDVTSNATLMLESPANFAGMLNVAGVGDTIVAQGATSISFTGGSVITLGGAVGQLGTIQLGASYTADQVQFNNGTITIACFAAGTRIATGRGDVAVEALRLGEAVALADGGAAPIVWLGHRTIDCARHPRPWDVLPVRVRAHAFGPGRPHTDLMLSPDHAVFWQGHLIPIRYLINGATVMQEQVATVTYWHVELPRHAALLAEGLAAESFLDTGNRDAFANGGPAIQLHPDFSRGVWAAESFAPLLLEGPALVAAHKCLLAHARRLGYALTGDPGLRVLADGRPVAARAEGGLWRARLPHGTTSVRLLSRVWVPAHTRPEETDTGTLGVAISRIWLDGREMGLDSPALRAGWRAAEAGWRWTDGDAELLLDGVREVAFAVTMTGTYWRRRTAKAARAA